VPESGLARSLPLVLGLGAVFVLAWTLSRDQRENALPPEAPRLTTASRRPPAGMETVPASNLLPANASTETPADGWALLTGSAIGSDGVAIPLDRPSPRSENATAAAARTAGPAAARPTAGVPGPVSRAAQPDEPPPTGLRRAGSRARGWERRASAGQEKRENRGARRKKRPSRR
jgi:hypothetical protein